MTNSQMYFLMIPLASIWAAAAFNEDVPPLAKMAGMIIMAIAWSIMYYVFVVI